jgi:hypothetical protein
MSKTMKVMLVLALCFATALAFGQTSTQTPTYQGGTTKGQTKWGTVPAAGAATTIGTPGGTMGTGYAFDPGQQFNSKWQMVGGNHDLTSNAAGINGPQTWTTKVVALSALCSFCHTAHDNEGTADRTFLWAHELPASFGTPYSSPTLQSSPSTDATSQTAQCLGCHDGTVALSSGNYGTPATTEDFYINGTAITTNGMLSEPGLIVPLSRTHPVSFTYDATLAAKHQLRVPADSKSIDGFGIVPLYNGKMECATCHDPHIKSGIMRRQFPTGATQDNNTGSFCLYCHL